MIPLPWFGGVRSFARADGGPRAAPRKNCRRTDSSARQGAREPFAMPRRRCFVLKHKPSWNNAGVSGGNEGRARHAASPPPVSYRSAARARRASCCIFPLTIRNPARRHGASGLSDEAKLYAAHKKRLRVIKNKIWQEERP